MGRRARGGQRFQGHFDETGWRAFLGSWKWATILFVACICGLIAIVNAQLASVSVRVSDRLGQPSSCTEVGSAQVAGVHSTIYRCMVGTKTQAQCFAISGHNVKQLSGIRD